MTPPLASLRDVPEHTVFMPLQQRHDTATEGTHKDDSELAKINM